jgi:hypothetical protein
MPALSCVENDGRSCEARESKKFDTEAPAAARSQRSVKDATCRTSVLSRLDAWHKKTCVHIAKLPFSLERCVCRPMNG